MIKKRGIVRKTFIFTSVLITLVVVISFGILYFFLPDYYYYSKKLNLNKNAELFVQKLTNAKTKNECADLISIFSLENNSDVMSFDKDNNILPKLSSPFTKLNVLGEFKVGVQVEEYELPEDSITEKSDFIFYDTSIGTKVASVHVGLFESASNFTISKNIQNSFISHITIISTLQPIDEAKKVILSLMPVLLIIGVLIALISAYFYAKQLTKPIITISEAAVKMQRMVPDILSNIHSNDELGILSQNLDSMYRSLWATIENLKHEMERVNKLEQSKTDFMQAASHELKTPIAALNGIIEGMIDNVGIYKNKEKYLEESKKLIDRLSALVNEILNAAAIENLEETIVLEPVEISTVLDRALKNYQVLIEEKKLHVSVEKSNFIYETDEKIFLNTLSNILSNAVKYTEKEGELYISLKPDNDSAVLSIENECANVPDKKLQKLFEPFYTLDYSRDKSKSGTGLGLYIVNRNLEDLQIEYKIKNTSLGFRFSLFLK